MTRQKNRAAANLAKRQREYDALPSEKKDGRKRPGSMSGRKS